MVLEVTKPTNFASNDLDNQSGSQFIWPTIKFSTPSIISTIDSEII